MDAAAAEARLPGIFRRFAAVPPEDSVARAELIAEVAEALNEMVWDPVYERYDDYPDGMYVRVVRTVGEKVECEGKGGFNYQPFRAVFWLSEDRDSFASYRIMLGEPVRPGDRLAAAFRRQFPNHNWEPLILSKARSPAEPREAAIAGEGFRLVLRVVGYARPDLESGADANWLSGEAELTASESFSGRQGISLRTEDIADFRDQLAEIVESLDGEAVLSHLEEHVGCTISIRNGIGEVGGFVRDDTGAELRVISKRADQSYLRASLRDFDALVDEFPIKGDPLA